MSIGGLFGYISNNILYSGKEEPSSTSEQYSFGERLNMNPPRSINFQIIHFPNSPNMSITQGDNPNIDSDKMDQKYLEEENFLLSGFDPVSIDDKKYAEVDSESDSSDSNSSLNEEGPRLPPEEEKRPLQNQAPEEDPPAAPSLWGSVKGWLYDHRKGIVQGAVVALASVATYAYLTSESYQTICFKDQGNNQVAWCADMPVSADVTKALYEKYQAIQDWAHAGSFVQKTFEEIGKGQQFIYNTYTKFLAK